ncbi:universal stress protein [Actinoallomurus purpureus]|uniref:universal stress protein n=1 Tax=Actinoallomurus purpureus TaxID=478114 RepID=UPI0020937C67|nr:universal stress protein [Actinoallomurus purpureus]MCO6010024.1 universal stress protein [Actinoallomurus purpureus]
MQPIVVGTDGSPRAGLAVEWAAEEAGRTGRPLHILNATERWPCDIPFHPAPGLSESLSETSDRILGEAVELALKTRPDIEVTTELVQDTPSEALREAAGGAHELVLGHRGLGGLAALLLGSTGLKVAGHAPGPVIIVRGETGEPQGEVVVGVDRTGESALALRYAFETAAIRGAWVRAVHVWEMPSAATAGAYPAAIRAAAAAAAEGLAGVVAPWRERYPEVRVVEQAPSGHTVGELVERSAHADLLVVGARSNCGGRYGLHLGSVSHGVIHHSRCPVAVVRARL